MRIGALIEGSTVDEIVDHVRSLADAGRRSAWLTDGLGFDPLTVLALVGRAVPDIELGTAVARTHTRHPMELAQQALTVNSAIGGRFCLGIGPSHRESIEQAWGLDFGSPVAHIGDYLSILGPLLADGAVDFDGDTLSAHGSLFIDDGRPCPVLLGALGPRMLALAGSLADGTITFMTGPNTLATFTCPTITEAAERAGRPTPRVVAMLPVCVTDDVQAAHERVERGLAPMAALPNYAAALAREGGLPLVAGSEDSVLAAIGALEEAGVTDLVPTRAWRRGSEDQTRTTALLDTLRS